MNRQPPKRSNLFLLELIIAILFFCLTSAVCVRFFVRSHITEEDITRQNHAVSLSSSVAELVRGGTDPEAAITAIYPEVTHDGDLYTICFDEDWEACGPDSAVYQLDLKYAEENSFALGDITVSDTESGGEIYHLDVKKYLQKEENDQ